MEIKTIKPKLVFFQWKHEGLPKFLQMHMQLHVKCLSEFFDVILINKDCDYQQICDIHQPDITLFESGFRSKVSRKITIKNTCTHREIPKLGLHNGDAWCDCRAGFISDMEHWGIETFFSISTTTAEHTPSIAKNLYAWPNFIDGDVYRDYGQNKTVPVLFTGFMNSLYPWRQKICEIISAQYQSLTLPHSGYKSSSSTMVQGEQYARAINASWFVPACGTIAREVVRKHFEIPGSKSCLLTEESPSVKAAGFLDMQNCVYADEKNVLDKLNYLFQNTDKLNEIINAGYEFVHSRHTLKQRDQIFQWYNLYKNLNPDEKIVQLNPFEPLIVVPNSSEVKNTPIVCNGIHLTLLRQGDENLWEGNYDKAEALYLKCLRYIDWMREPKLKLAICNLYKGNADAAFHWIIEPVTNSLRVYKALDPDPVEWTYFIVALLCKGKLNEAIIRANQFPLLHHPELDRIRWVANYLQNKNDKILSPYNKLEKPRYSIHELPQLSFVEWINNLCIMLRACQRESYATLLSKAIFAQEVMSAGPLQKKYNPVRLFKTYLILFRISCQEKLNSIFSILYMQNPKAGLPPVSVVSYFIQVSRREKIELAKRFTRVYLSRLNTHIKPLISFASVNRKKG